MSHKNSGFFMALWALLLLALAPAPAQAAVYTWNGGSGNWKVATNWSPVTGPPNGYDTAIIPSGTVTLDTLYSVKNLTLGAGATLLITQWGLDLKSDNPENTCLVTNNGSIQVINPGPNNSALGSAQGSIVSFTGGGEVVLGGPYNLMGNGGWGGSFVNEVDHTIRGGGYIQAGVANQGQIIADSGTLYLQAPFINTGAVIKAEGAGNAVELSSATVTGGDLLPQDGKVIQRGGGVEFTNVNLGPGIYEVYGPNYLSIHGDLTLTPGHQVTLFPGGHLSFPDNGAIVTNNSVIRMNGTHDDTCYFKGTSGTLTGTGRIVMGGDLGNHLEGWTQGPNHTIEGGGSLSSIINNGAIKANNGPFKINDVTNNGTFEFADNVDLNLNHGLFTVGDFFLPLHSSFKCDNLATLNVMGNISFPVQDVTKWVWVSEYPWGGYIPSTLQMSGGGPWQSLEVGCRDLGEDNTGLNNNFALWNLKLQGTGTRVYLADNIDNGHRSPGVKEALYTGLTYNYGERTLDVPSGTTLNLNGIHLYSYSYAWGRMVLVKAGDNYGGGQIIDVPMGPGTLLAPIRSLLLD